MICLFILLPLITLVLSFFFNNFYINVKLLAFKIFWLLTRTCTSIYKEVIVIDYCVGNGVLHKSVLHIGSHTSIDFFIWFKYHYYIFPIILILCYYLFHTICFKVYLEYIYHIFYLINTVFLNLSMYALFYYLTNNYGIM